MGNRGVVAQQAVTNGGGGGGQGNNRSVAINSYPVGRGRNKGKGNRGVGNVGNRAMPTMYRPYP